jgi:hypothetical protein
VLNGGFVGYSRIELFGQEANVVVPLTDDANWQIDLLAGARFLQMRDRYHHTATNFLLPDQAVITGVVDNYRVGNAFYGAQLGLRGEWTMGRASLQGRGSVALGVDTQRVRTFGERVYADPQQRIETARGLFVQPSNTGTFHRTQFDWAGDVGVNAGWQLTERVRLQVGYSFFWWADPLRAGDLVDRVVNQTPGSLPNRPSIPWQGDLLWAHGVNLGIDLRW